MECLVLRIPFQSFKLRNDRTLWQCSSMATKNVDKAVGFSLGNFVYSITIFNQADLIKPPRI